jgi:REP element-mobilizing transposase RayT
MALAYLITFRCYGTWLHGDARGSMDRHGASGYGDPIMAPSGALQRWEESQLRSEPFELGPDARPVVRAALEGVCERRGWVLLAVNVRTNHVHAVVAAEVAPEVVLNSLKAWATRGLRQAGVLAADAPAWSRHGSTVHLWTEDQVADAQSYVLYGQGAPLGQPLGDGRGDEA